MASMMEEGVAGPRWNGERLKQMVEVVLSADKTGEPVIRTKTKIFMIRRWAAAAAIIIGFATGSYFLFFHKKQANEIAIQPQAVRFKNDVAPGIKKAVLTLSGGQHIIIDSVKNGAVAKQANVQIIKTSGSELAYKPLNEKPGSVQYNDLSVPRGAPVIQMTLADGTRVWMNAASSLHYPTTFSGKERSVELTGEAYFEVAKNPSMPFHVKFNGTDVEVLGTHFNVMAYDDEPGTKTTLLEGKVKVSKGTGSLIINPGEQAIVNPLGQITLDKNVNIEMTMAWKNGLFDFTDEKMENIMRQIARWYDVDVTYEGDTKNLVFGLAISRKENVSKLLNYMELTGTVHFRIEGNKITVTP